MSDQSAPLPATRRSDLRGELGSFAPQQMAALGLMAVAVIILGMWFFRWSTTPTWEVVSSGLSPTETAELTDALEGEGIDFRLSNNGTAIEVPSGDSQAARVAVGASGGVGAGSPGYELLDEQGFLASSFRQRVDYQRAVEGELARTILSMEAVTSATVHLAIPEDRVFAEDQNLTRASVVVGGAIDANTVTAIANVVASAVPGLDSANVTVAETSGRVLSGGNGASGVSSDQRLQTQDLVEAQLEMAVESMLTTALGPGNAIVRVTADLNFDELESESVSYSADESVTLREQTLDEAFTGDENVPVGTLGVAAEANDLGEIAGDEGSAYVRAEQNSEYGVPTTRTVSRKAPGSVERITVAVLVDSSLDPAPDAGDLSDLVAAAVGIDDARGDTVVVQAMPFEELEESEIDLTPAEAGPAQLDMMLGYAKTGAAVLGMILALLFLRKGIKTLIPATEREPVDIEEAVAELTSGGSDDGDGDDDGAEVETPAIASLGPGDPPTTEGGPDMTVDMLALIDSQSDEVAILLQDLVSEAV